VRWIIVEIRGGTEESAKCHFGAAFLGEIALGSRGYWDFQEGPDIEGMKC
jgi:hypothetical protein